MSLKVLIASYYFPPMNGPVTQHPRWYLRYLAEAGLEPHVVSSSVYFGENLGAAKVPGNVHSVPERPRGRRAALLMARLELYLQNRMGIWEHGFPWAATHGYREASRLVKGGGFGAVVSVSPSMASHWLAFRLKKRFPALRWIADFTDPFIGNPFRHTPPWLVTTEHRLEAALFASADYIGANTEPVRQMWRAAYPEHRDKFVVLPNGFDPDEPIEPRPLPARPAPLVAHVGGVYGGRVPNALFEGLYALLTAGRIHPAALVVEFLGASNFNNVARPEQLAALRDAGIVRVRNEYVPREEALVYTAEADGLLLLDVTEPHNTRLQVPSKLFDYVRVGRPILAFTACGSPTEEILERAGVQCVIVDNRAPAERVQEQLMEFLALDAEVRRPSQWLIDNFDARTICRRVGALITGTPVPSTGDTALEPPVAA